MDERNTGAAITPGIDSGALARGTLLNILGLGLPLLVAIACLPVVVGRLGAARFGVLALVWALLGYAAVFDFGFGRAVARHIAAALGRNAQGDVPRVLGSALAAQGVFGLIGGAVVLAVAPAFRAYAVDLPPALAAEAQSTLPLVALAVPIVVLASSLRGALYAARRFDLVNAVLVPASSSLYVLSALGALAGWTLPAIVAALVAAKAVTLGALWILVRRHCPGMAAARLSWDAASFRALAGFGSWATVSAMVVPVANQAERLVIPALLSIASLGFYAVPHEALSRAALVPASMALVLFPAFAGLDRADARLLTGLVTRPARHLAVIMTPPMLGACLFSYEVLSVWMGVPFAREASSSLQILAVAFYLGVFSHVLRTALHGLNRPDLKASLDLALIVLLVTALVTLIPRAGLPGAATARLLTMAVELIGLIVLVGRVAPEGLRVSQLAPPLAATFALTGAYVGLAIISTWLLPGAALALGSFLLLTSAYVSVFWFRVADPTDRHAVRQLSRWRANRHESIAAVRATERGVP